MAVPGAKWARRARRTGLHGALVLGSLVFSLPFLWLLSTAAKQEEEIFVYPPEIIPYIPGAVAASPWIDPHAYRSPARPEEMSLAAWLEKKTAILGALHAETARLVAAEAHGLSKSEAAVSEAADGVWEKTSLRLPAEAWLGDPERIAQELTRSLSEASREEILDTIQRRLVLGEVRLDSWSLERVPVSNDAEAARQWDISSGERAQAVLEPTVDSGKSGALVRYHMDAGRRIVFRGTFALPFAPDDFKRIVLSLRGDASWNTLSCVVEFGGRRFSSHQPYYLARGTWQQVMWQFLSWEDTTRAQRLWRLLYPETGAGPAFDEPGKIRIELTLSRLSGFGRIIGKLDDNYREALNYMPFWRYVNTSVILVALNILGELLGASLVAFAFARLRWPGRGFCFVLVLSTLMVPMQVMMIPRFLIYRWLGWYNTWAPLWVPSFFGSAFYIFLLVQFMRSIPTDLEDSAKIDGAGFFRIYWSLILPLIKPALAAISIFTFMGVWNDFMRPLIYLADQRLYPLSLGLYALQAFLAGSGAGRQGIMMAASVMMTLPVIVLFFAAQRQFIQGVTLTGMKG